MIYRLNDEFTKIEETEGVLENKSIHSRVEIAVSDTLPAKDTGIELQPKEKMPFCVKENKNLYVRCTDLDHMGANIAVENFNMFGAGNPTHSKYKTLWQGSIGVVSGASVTETIDLYDTLSNYKYFDIVFYSFDYNSSNFTAPQIRRFRTSDLQYTLEQDASFIGGITVCRGYSDLSDYATILRNSTMQKLNINIKCMYVKEIIGIN